MQEILQRISAFFMAILASFLGLFGIKQPSVSESPPVVQEEIEAQGDWLLTDLPAFDAGLYSSALYDTGTGLFDDTAVREDEDFEEGDLSQNACAVTGQMQLIRKTTPADALLYGEKLKSVGYTLTYSHQIENNFYYNYEKGNRNVYYYCNGNSGETRVIDERSTGASLQTFSYSSGKTAYIGNTPVPPTVYQFSYPYRDAEHVGKDNYGSNGMLYAVALSDGKLIVIDGGNRWQSSEQNVTEFFDFLHTISGTPQEKPLRIALWYCTHSHGDHNAFFYKLLRRYSDRIALERAMFNFPSERVMTKNAYATRIRSILATRYPALQYLKAHSGASFRLQDALFEVLYAHEDLADLKDASVPLDDLNEGCCVVRMTIGQTRFLFLGDALTLTQNVLLKNFSAQTLKCDVMQASHHLLVNLAPLYDVVAPAYVMCPTSKLRASATPYDAYLHLLKSLPEERLFFAGDGIAYGFTPQADGSIALPQIAVNCGAYDNSLLH